MRSARTFVFIVLSLMFLISTGADSVVTAQFLPYYREVTCGPNCLYAVCLLKSVDTTLEKVYQLAEVTEKGTSMQNLLDVAKSLGLNPQPLKTTLKNLATTNAYAIVHLKQNHFVLCVGWRGDELVIVDPPKDAYLMSKKDFQDQWTGYALLFDRATDKDIYNPGKSKNDLLSRKSASKESGVQPSSDTDPPLGNVDHIPEMTKVILSSIRKAKSTRNEIRKLYTKVNKSASKLDVSCWLNGKPLSLEQLNDRIIILWFWSIQCGACYGEIETLNKMHESLHSDPVTIIAVHSYTDDLDKVKSVITEKKIRFAVCMDKKSSISSQGKTFDAYGTTVVPRSFLVDVHGQVRSVVDMVGPTLEELIEESTDGILHTTLLDLDQRFGVKVSPKRIYFGELSPKYDAHKSVYIYKPDDPAFKMNIESAPDKPATAKLFRFEGKDALLYELRVFFKADLQGEHYNSEIKLKTNDIRTPEIILPVTALAQSADVSRLPH